MRGDYHEFTKLAVLGSSFTKFPELRFLRGNDERQHSHCHLPLAYHSVKYVGKGFQETHCVQYPTSFPKSDAYGATTTAKFDVKI